jgi:hypothetical protein
VGEWKNDDRGGADAWPASEAMAEVEGNVSANVGGLATMGEDRGESGNSARGWTSCADNGS